MATGPSMKRVQFTVSWPVQGVACFRSQESELVLSDVYWRWIFEELLRVSDNEHQLPFVHAVEEGFCDASNLVETIPVSASFLELLQRLEPSNAPSFERVVPSEGCAVPTADQILAAFVGLVGEAVPAGTMQMEIE